MRSFPVFATVVALTLLAGVCKETASRAENSDGCIAVALSGVIHTLDATMGITTDTYRETSGMMTTLYSRNYDHTSAMVATAIGVKRADCCAMERREKAPHDLRTVVRLTVADLIGPVVKFGKRITASVFVFHDSNTTSSRPGGASARSSVSGL